MIALAGDSNAGRSGSGQAAPSMRWTSPRWSQMRPAFAAMLLLPFETPPNMPPLSTRSEPPPALPRSSLAHRRTR